MGCEIIATQVSMLVAVDQLPIVYGTQALGDQLEARLEDNISLGSVMVDMDGDRKLTAIHSSYSSLL